MRNILPTLCFLATALLATAADKAAVDPAIAAAIAKVDAAGASLMPLAADGKAYRFTALNVAKEFTDAGLEPLAPVADKIASLDLARTKITDAGLKAVAGMKGLKELHLENTGITDAGLEHLKGLAELEYLNLYNTKVTDAGIQKIASLGKLKSLYLWQTGVTKAGVAQLKAKLPQVHVNTGWTAEDDAKPVAVAATAPAAGAGAKPAAPETKPAAAAKPAAAPAKPAAAVAKLDPAIAAKAVLYKDVVAPILAAKCTSCHGEEKKKGKLQLHDFAAIMKGGSEGASVVAGKPAESLLLTRINLPVDDDEHMPPEDEPQVTKDELAILKWWIESGASESVTVAAAKPNAEVEGALAAVLAKGLPKAEAATAAKPEKDKPKTLTEAEKKQVAEVTAKLQALNASLMPLAQDTELLRLSVINAADKFGDKEVALLEPIAAHVVWVDLARSQITNAGAETLAKMANLERLHLENTKITDASLAKLGSLQSLEYLNLYGTKTTDAGIANLATAKGLKKLFVWQTGVTQAGAKALEGKLPGLKVNVGLSEAEIAKLTAPPPAPAPAKEPKKEAAKPVEKKEEAKPAATKPAETKPAVKSAEAKAATAPAVKAAATPPAAKPADAKPAETKPAPAATAKPADAPPAAKPAPAKPADAPPAAKPEATKPVAPPLKAS